MNQPAAPRAVTILGNKPAAIPIGGTIRAGIKVLTRTAASNPEAKRIYDEGVAAGISFDDIQKNIRKVVPNLTYPLTPRNTDYFTVRRCDFPNPEMADLILNLYGEEKNGGPRRLYRFPVVFAADAWQDAMPHNLACFSATERRYWSEYNADGVRECHCRPPAAEPKNNGKRAVRNFGGRGSILRPENNGVCDPANCNEYQTRQCNLSGKFLFYIPGVPGISAIQVPTGSFYGMDAAIKVFNAITHMRGRVSGFLDNGEGKATFYLSKKLRDLPFINEEGQVSTAPQWVIDLEANVDVTELLRTSQNTKALTLRAAASAALLEAPGTIAASEADIVVEATGGAQEDAGSADPAREVIIEGELIAGTTAPAAGPTPAPKATVAPRAAVPVVGDEQLGDVLTLLDGLGVESALYLAYADAKYGIGWRRSNNGRNRAVAEIKGYQGNAQALMETLTEALMAN